jgi:acetylornithine/succinyldiaminopimelate/putrescine aminotransferase
MSTHWITPSDEAYAKSVFAKTISGARIPDEKKPYLLNHKKCSGPYLAVEGSAGETSYLLDAASQIASVGLGFNARSSFGVAHTLDSWLNLKDTEDYLLLRKAYHALLQRNLSWQNLHTLFCNSGAEANEIALGAAYTNRKHAGAKKVLAFEGSFHGRMLVSLWSSWSPSKREPFQWPGFETTFVKYPESKDGRIDYAVQAGWRELWASAPVSYFDEMFKEFISTTNNEESVLRQEEIQSLLKIREELLTKKYYAIIIEPMQCEGGDAYSTVRFHNALINMAKAFQIALIYDEVQTGFHLGKTFFWHKQFELKDEYGKPLAPDYIVTAKKAQVGIVMSHEPIDFENVGSTANLQRGLLQGTMLEQYHAQILEIEKSIFTKLTELTKKYSDLITDPRGQGLAFAFRFLDAKNLNTFVALRFSEAVMLYPAGSDTARFRLNLSFQAKDIELLFCRLENMLRSLRGEAVKPVLDNQYTKGKSEYDYQCEFILNKFKSLTQTTMPKPADEIGKIVEAVIKKNLPSEMSHLEARFISKNQFEVLCPEIERLEKTVYEPARVTDISEFRNCVMKYGGRMIALFDKHHMVGMICGGPIQHHGYVKGTQQDPYFNTEGVDYILATTIDNNYQKHGLGLVLKLGYLYAAQAMGIERVEGRNRDIYAKSMLNLNFSLGAIELFRLPHAYEDEGDGATDAIYYTMPVHWRRDELSLSSGLTSPIVVENLTEDFVQNQISNLTNKMTISNFVDKDYLMSLQKLIDILPTKMRHAYTASGQSECVDKVAKSIWGTRKHSYRMLTFEGHYFGEGSFLSRALSGSKSSYFDVTRMNSESTLDQVEHEISTGIYFAVWVEPIQQKSFQRMTYDYLRGLKNICDKYNVPLIYNETASQIRRYHKDYYFAVNDESIAPTASFCFLGGQMGVCFINEKYFIKEPLAIISTWDADAYSLASYMMGNCIAFEKPAEYQEIVSKFEVKFKELLIKYNIHNYELQNGCGYIASDLPQQISKYCNYDKRSQHWVICPSLGAMTRFCNE